VAQAATLKDVARLAGVSVSTVARVLHGNGYVAPKTRDVVEGALTQTSYQVNTVAQGLRKRRTFTLGHVLLSVSPNPFFAGVALGLEQEAWSHDCGVLTVNTQANPESERLGVQTLIQRRVDAILFTTCTDAGNIQIALDAGVPVVQVERLMPIETDAVTIDNCRGSFEATEHLIALGHRRIAYLGEPPESGPHDPRAQHSRLVEQERLTGYLDALRTHGLPVDEALIALGGTYDDLVQARVVTKRLLTLPADRRPSAIFATCDLLASGVLQQLYAQGLRVPDDLSVVGFDDTYAPHLTPPLTTVAQPMIEIGRAAARLALGRLQGAVSDQSGDVQPRTETRRLATRLIIRDSTGRAPEATVAHE
jgi:DNA-binding LacI/PurR family transcriptional regulator